MPENSTTPPEQTNTQRAIALIAEGRADEAFALLQEQVKSELADDHPAKGLQPQGVLVGDQVSRLARHDAAEESAKDALYFMQALLAGGPGQEAASHTLSILVRAILEEHQGIVPSLTRYIKNAWENGIDFSAPIDYRERP